MARQFQFTHPGRGATRISKRSHPFNIVSIHAPREGCDATAQPKAMEEPVSIHAPREGCDFRRITLRCSAKGFNSRTPGGVRLRSDSFCLRI